MVKSQLETDTIELDYSRLTEFLESVWRGGNYGVIRYPVAPMLEHAHWVDMSDQNTELDLPPDLWDVHFYSTLCSDIPETTDPEHVRPQNVVLQSVSCIFVDDVEHIPKNLPPSFQWSTSPGKSQAIWLLDKSVDITSENHRKHVQSVQNAFVDACGGDSSAKPLAHSLRLPLSRRTKDGITTHCEFRIYQPDRTYPLSDIEKSVGFDETKSTMPDISNDNEAKNKPVNRMPTLAEMEEWLDLYPASELRSGDWDWKCVVRDFAKYGMAGKHAIQRWSKKDFERYNEHAFETAWNAAVAIYQREGHVGSYDGLHLWRLAIEYDPTILEPTRRICEILKGNFTRKRELETEYTDAEPANEVDSEPTARFEFLTFNDIKNRPPKEWLVQHIIGKNDLIMLYGESGSGKTHVTIDLIFSCLTGQQFANRFDVTRQLTVIYCAGEGQSGVFQRFQAVADKYGNIGLENLIIVPETPQLSGGSDSIDTFVGEYMVKMNAGLAPKPDLIILDTLHTSTAGMDENSSMDMGIALAAMKNAIRRLDCAILVNHHKNKAGQERGSTALKAAMDVVISVSEEKGRFTMECAKIKDGERWAKVSFTLAKHLDSVYISWSTIGSKMADMGNKTTMLRASIVALLESAEEPMTATEIKVEVDSDTKDKNAVQNVLKDMAKTGDITKSLQNPDMKYSPRGNLHVYSLANKKTNE